MSVAVKVYALLSDILGVDVAARPQLRRVELPEWDSLSHMRIVVTMEDEFGLRLSADQAAELQSASQLVALAEAAR